MLITYLQSEFQNSKWRIQNGGKVHDFLLGVFEVADYETEVRILKFKITVYSKIMYLEKINTLEIPSNEIPSNERSVPYNEKLINPSSPTTMG